MKIVSVSLDEETLNKIEQFQQKGYRGRSEVFRAAIKSLEEKESEHAKLKGVVNAVLMVKHEEKYAESLMSIRHTYQSLIQTHIHTHLEDHTCLELFMLKGPGERIKKLIEAYQTSKKVKLVKLLVS